ncbi:MAG: hypothetical protein ABIS86_10605 [Streptosporangiaceae bacterium]
MSEYTSALHSRLRAADRELRTAVDDGDDYTAVAYAAEIADLLESARRNGADVPHPRDWHPELAVSE